MLWLSYKRVPIGHLVHYNGCRNHYFMPYLVRLSRVLEAIWDEATVPMGEEGTVLT